MDLMHFSTATENDLHVPCIECLKLNALNKENESIHVNPKQKLESR